MGIVKIKLMKNLFCKTCMYIVFMIMISADLQKYFFNFIFNDFIQGLHCLVIALMGRFSFCFFATFIFFTIDFPPLEIIGLEGKKMQVCQHQ